MMKPWDLRDLSSGRDINDFLDSFDAVFTDCDGVLWQHSSPIDGSMDVLNRLQKMGKSVYFVSNNATLTEEQYCAKFQKLGFTAQKEQIVIPSKVIAWHLKNIGFQDEAYVIGNAAFKRVLENEGIRVVQHESKKIDSIEDIVNLTRDRPSIKAVIGDFDPNYNWISVMRAISYLRRDDTLYLSGAENTIIYFVDDLPLVGPGPFLDVINEYSGRKPTPCAKPSNILKHYLLEKCKMANPERCIFIGDTIVQDMKFGTLCGFSKFFVESGIVTLEEAVKEEDSIPDFYLPTLGLLLPLLDRILQNGSA